MASDRPAPAKRPPRPAAKKAAPPPSGPRKPSAAAAAAAAKKKGPVRRRRRDVKKTVGAIVALAVVASLVVFFAFSISNSGSPTSSPAATVGPEKIPVPAGKSLAAINTGVYPQSIDGIDCQVNEQAVTHTHTHLSIFVDGAAKQIPFGIGIAPPLQMGSNVGGDFASGGICFYWVHTHAADGIIHVESPNKTQQVTLGNFFDMWGQPLGTAQVGPALGKLTVYVDGKLFVGDPRAIALTNHSDIQLDIGTNVAPSTIDWTSSGL